jgi:hypothetical protein
MKFTYNNVAFHELGDVTIVSQGTTYSPEEVAQKETRTFTVKIDTWEQSYSENYDLIATVRNALSATTAAVLWQGDDEVSNGDTVPGPIYLSQVCEVTGNNLPENPNSWGSYQQSITIDFKYVVDRTSSTDALKMTFKKTGATGPAKDMGIVSGWKDGFKSKRFHDLHSDLETVMGELSASGEFLANPNDALTARRVYLATKKAELDTALQGNDGTLTFGPSGQFMNRVVKCDAWTCEVNQAATKITWSLTASYVLFPDSSGFAGAEFKVASNEDKETGEKTLAVEGKVIGSTKALALAKFEALRAAMLEANGFTEANLINTSLTDTMFNPPDATAANVFVEVAFAYNYRKRAANIMSYTLVVSDKEDEASGMIARTYSGSVTATSSTEDAAYDAAAAKARELGEDKLPFKVSSTITRNDRKTAVGTQEFVRVEFSFEYKTKAERIYIEIRSESSSETFGDNTSRVSGFVAAKSFATARAVYQEQVKAAYSGMLIRSEQTQEIKLKIEQGATTSKFSGTGKYDTLEAGFEFGFSAYTPRTDGNWSIKYALSVDKNFTSLRKVSSVRGQFFGSPAEISAAISETGGNALDTFLAALNLGSVTQSSRSASHEKLGTSIDNATVVEFSQSFESAIAVADQIIQCQVREEIEYSGTRWVFQSIPNGADIAQNCGIERGGRVITGSVVASNETAAMAWIKKQNPANSASVFYNFPTGIGGGDNPATRYFLRPKIERDWDFVALSEGVARGNGANGSVFKASFTFAEALPNFPYTE